MIEQGLFENHAYAMVLSLSVNESVNESVIVLISLATLWLKRVLDGAKDCKRVVSPVQQVQTADR